VAVIFIKDFCMVMRKAANIIAAIVLIAIGLVGLGALDWLQWLKP
jgi:hypothetical protein